MGLEVVIRPVVLPNIRPAPAQSLPPADDPTKGFCTINGNPAKEVNFSTSWSQSTSKSIHVETERTEDTARVYQMDDNGNVNKKNFVDVAIARKIHSRGGAQPEIGGMGEGGAPDPATLTAARKRNEEISEWYQKQVEQLNIEIKKRDQVRKNPDESGSD
jgi:hypothetical protein